MAIANSALNILAFPQRWDGAQLTVRWLCLPQDDPQAPLQPGLTAFAAAELQFEARLIGGLDHLPRAADATPVGPLALSEPPVQKAAAFEALRAALSVQDDGVVPPPVPPPRFRKPVTPSYRDLVGDRQLSAGLADLDAYDCALHQAHEAQPPEPVVLPQTWSWGEALALALRQPKLAMALGLIAEAPVPLDDPAIFARGGWLYVGLSDAGDLAAAPGLVTSFAARIPPLTVGVPRDIFAAVLFPLDDPGVADDAFPEAEQYDRGFARLVHGAQGDAQGDGIRLAWDDEQVADAFARQVADDSTRPMGTAGYRIDVRDVAGDGAWRSLQRVASLGDLQVGDVVIGPYTGEQIVEVVPVQTSPALAGDFWMPPYFCTWRGASLVLTDPELVALQQGAIDDPRLEPMRLGREQAFAPVGDKDTPLTYGHDYEFRVRLADLSRGGPEASAETPPDPDGEARHLTRIAFRRGKAPGQVQVAKRPTADDLTVVLGRPRLGYPELLFTADGSFAKLKDALNADVAALRTQALGLPDPDVSEISIQVEVRALLGDEQTWLPLYATKRAFPVDGVTLALEKRDLATFRDLDAIQPLEGSLVVPTARDIRLVLTPVGEAKADYYSSEAVRRGPPVTVEVRAAAQAEGPLFAGDLALDALFFRPPVGGAPPTRPMERLAQDVGLEAHGLTLAAPAGERTVFGCADSVRHVLSPERASITVASDAELNQRWINVLRFELDRDWTWDGLAPDGLTIHRTVSRGDQLGEKQIVGSVALPRTIARQALPPGSPADPEQIARDPRRSATDVVFLDALDPKPEPDRFPCELTVAYEIQPTLRDGLPPPDTLQASVLLPVTTPPAQTPKLVSAGIALSPHEATSDYASTNQRQRMLWLEFDALPADPQDAYFVRVLASAPDPLLTDEVIAPLAPEPALTIEPEMVRHIVPDQPRDDSGLRAMQPLERPSAEGPHYLIPLPKGLEPQSPELLGMFTYEVRLGHTGARWSTAQGRFGPPLRVAGVQHPPPPLACQAARVDSEIQVRAPFATPVHDGRHVRPAIPKTRLWALLYARVQQTDAAAWRNLLLLKRPLRPRIDHPERPEPQEAAPPQLHGDTAFAQAEVDQELRARGLAPDASVTVLVAEFLSEPDISDPLGVNLGHARMLRVSPLVTVPDAC